jgi:fructan beta-fructosidase
MRDQSPIEYIVVFSCWFQIINLMNVIVKVSPLIVLVAALSCKKTELETTPAVVVAKEYTEKHRPQVHFSPPAKWMNDPNGMVYMDGEYHLFYQYFPDSTVWGPMHWGHAVTKDLIHWEHLPIALYPDSLGYIFSGSAVVDTANTSGFGSRENPAMVAIYTYHDVKGERAGNDDFQTQGIAYSTDKGRSWTKYDQNPVLKNTGIRDFRDPKVSWIDESKQWVMTLAVKDHIEFYGSPDLKAWKKLSEFGKTDGSHGGVWECPDLFELRDEKGKSKFVLLVSINPGAPNGGSGTQYFVGDFDGIKFISDTPGKNSGWVDYGTDNYAGVTFANIPGSDDRRIFMGWMSNWFYAQVVPTIEWRSAMTVPRTLTLETSGKGHLLKSNPVAELDGIIDNTRTLAAVLSADSIEIINGNDSTKIPLILKGSIKKADFTLEFSNKQGQRMVIGFDPGKNEFFIDRSVNMPSNFYPDFKSRMVAPRNSSDNNVKFVAVVDVASIELFFDDGRTTLTAITFPDEVFNTIRLVGHSGTISTGEIQIAQLRPIW